MTRRRTRFRLLAVSVAAVAILAGAASAGAASAAAAPAAADPCAAAARQLQSGQLTLSQAEALEASLPQTAECAPERTAITALSNAQQLFAVGLTADAGTQIMKALNAVPLLKLPKGFVPAAFAGSSPPAASSPSAVSATPKPGGFSLRTAWDWLAIPVTLGLVLALLLTIAPWLYPRLRSRLHIQPFSLADAAAGIDPGGFRRQVLDELQRLADERARNEADRTLRLDIAGPYESQLDVHSVTDGISPIGPVLGRYLNWLLNKIPGRCRVLTGVLLRERGVRLKIATVHGEVEPAGSETIWHDELRLPAPGAVRDPVAARFAPLATAAAAWIILTRYPQYSLGGARSWRSFTQFAAGCSWQDERRLLKARELYAAAYQTDPDNLAAAYNLATLLLLATDDPESVRDGRRLLEYVLAATAGKPDNPQRLRARHLYAVVMLDADRYTGDLAPQPDEVKRAGEIVVDLALEMEEESLRREARAPGDQGRFGELPTRLIERSLGAVVASAACYLFPGTADPGQLSFDPPAGSPGSADTVLGLLRQAKGGPPTPGTAEKLAAFARVCEPTPESNYDLYRFQRKRLRLCQEAITFIRLAQQAGSAGSAEETERQLRELEAARRKAEGEMSEYLSSVASSGDALLMAALDRDGPVVRENGPDDADGGRDPETRFREDAYRETNAYRDEDSAYSEPTFPFTPGPPQGDQPGYPTLQAGAEPAAPAPRPNRLSDDDPEARS